jgi:hypothetical protein
MYITHTCLRERFTRLELPTEDIGKELGGLPATFGEAMPKKPVTLLISYIDYLTEVGKSNLSTGIRAAVNLLREMRA